jgi:hypothetical protein
MTMTTVDRKKAFTVAAATAALFGCTNTGLHRDVGPPPPPPKETIDVQGTFCTEDPETVEYPVKIWMVIDNTGSMNTNDPNEERFNAASALGVALEDTDPPPQMFFGAMIFSEGGLGTQRITLPDRFTPSSATLTANVDAVRGQANGGTPYVTALNFTFGELSADINVDPVAALRTRYVVIFLSDGIPTGNDDNPNTIAAAAETLVSLRDRAGDLTLNTIYLGGGNDEAEMILMNMATIGGGIYKSFPAGDELDFTEFDFSSIRRNYNQRFFMLSNLNALPSKTGHQVDSDQDGLADYFETTLGSELGVKDTDADGCSDLMEYKVGWDPLIPGTENNQCSCTPAQRTGDIDLDGMTDCEEKWLATSEEAADSDKNEDDTIIGDLVYDSLDFVYLDDVNFPNDGMDFDADGFQDLSELRTHTDPHASEDDVTRSRWAYDYVYLDQQPENPRCYDFRVENIAILPTAAADGRAAGDNEIILYFAQSPQDNAQKEKSFRRARVIVNRSDLDDVTVAPEDFDEILISAVSNP